MLFCSYDLDLNPMTLIYQFNLKILKMYLRNNNELLGQGFQTSHTDRQTDTQTEASENITTQYSRMVTNVTGNWNKLRTFPIYLGK